MVCIIKVLLKLVIKIVCVHQIIPCATILSFYDFNSSFPIRNENVIMKYNNFMSAWFVIFHKIMYMVYVVIEYISIGILHCTECQNVIIQLILVEDDTSCISTPLMHNLSNTKYNMYTCWRNWEMKLNPFHEYLIVCQITCDVWNCKFRTAILCNINVR